jgi:hypothetical protein
MTAAAARAPLSHAPDRPTVLTWTGSRTFRSCPLRFRRRYVERLPELASEPLDRGGAVHTVLEQIGRGQQAGMDLSDGVIARMIAETTATIHPEAANDAWTIVTRYLASGGIPALPSDAQDVAYEMPFAIDRNGRPVEWNSPDAMYRSVFDRVYRENGGALAVNDDYKTSWVIDEPGEQQRQYAWATCCLWPEVEEAVVALRFVRYGQCVRREVISRDEAMATGAALRALHDEVIDAVATDTFKPRVSNDCLTCAFHASCPEMQRAPMVVPVDGPAGAVEASRELVRLQVREKAVKAQLDAYVSVHGPVQDGDEVYGPVAREKKSAVPAVAAAVLGEHGVTDSDLWDAVSLPSANLNKLVTKAIASAAKKEKGAARERVVAAIDAAGGFERRTDVEIRRVKKASEVPADE